MALKLRFRRIGRRNDPKYRLVVANVRSPRDGRFVEELGHYDPSYYDQTKKTVFNKERIEYWLAQGCSVSDSVRPHLKSLGIELK